MKRRADTAYRLLWEPVDSVDSGLVLQYEVALQDGLEVAVHTLADDSFDGSAMSEKTPYSVMFGPDKCGTTNKVHLILTRTPSAVNGRSTSNRMFPFATTVNPTSTLPFSAGTSPLKFLSTATLSRAARSRTNLSRT